MISAPAAASAVAMARPSPLLPPVTRAVRPVSLNFSRLTANLHALMKETDSAHGDQERPHDQTFILVKPAQPDSLQSAGSQPDQHKHNAQRGGGHDDTHGEDDRPGQAGGGDV